MNSKVLLRFTFHLPRNEVSDFSNAKRFKFVRGLPKRISLSVGVLISQTFYRVRISWRAEKVFNQFRI
jgi:hypothetical protein